MGVTSEWTFIPLGWKWPIVHYHKRKESVTVKRSNYQMTLLFSYNMHMLQVAAFKYRKEEEIQSW